MIKIHLSTKSLLDTPQDAYVFFVEQGFDGATLQAQTDKLLPSLHDVITKRCFTGAAGSHLEVTTVFHDKAASVLVLGLGKRNEQGHLEIETYRRALGKLIRFTESHKLKTVGFALPDPAAFGLDVYRVAREAATILEKASYHFDEFITDIRCKLSFDCDITCTVKAGDEKVAQQGVEHGTLIAQAINKARYWCDMPPSRLTPKILADQAEELSKKNGLKTTIFGKEDILKMSMGGIEGVSRGSVEDPRLVILEYHAKKDAPTIALVGKGITFDSGGLSLKPAVAMETMKDDMAGAAVVIATMQVLAQLKPEVNVIALTPLSENLPSGSATKPGDVLRFYNGKTAEVKNTDAEGRLVLADALSYAVQNYKLDAILDIATLTGSCAAALGPFYAGLFSQHDDLTQRVIQASQISGDRVWRLPMSNDYKASIRSEIADICNIGNPKYAAGAITAAFFLQNFVGDVPWVHLDIAGVAFGVPDMSYLRPGATGFGIRLFTDLIMNWKK